MASTGPEQTATHFTDGGGGAGNRFTDGGGAPANSPDNVSSRRGSWLGRQLPRREETSSINTKPQNVLSRQRVVCGREVTGGPAPASRKQRWLHEAAPLVEVAATGATEDFSDKCHRNTGAGLLHKRNPPGKIGNPPGSCERRARETSAHPRGGPCGDSTEGPSLRWRDWTIYVATLVYSIWVLLPQ